MTGWLPTPAEELFGPEATAEGVGIRAGVGVGRALTASVAPGPRGRWPGGGREAGSTPRWSPRSGAWGQTSCARSMTSSSPVATSSTALTSSRSEPTAVAGGRAVAYAVGVRDPGDRGQTTIVAALPLSGVAPELAIVRQRVIVAMIVVLGLACLAGIALAFYLGFILMSILRA